MGQFTEKMLVEIIQAEILPAIGCTEPAAVALAVAWAARFLGGRLEKLEVTVSGNIFKNGMAVMIPNTGRFGLERAAALGAFLDPEEELNLFNSVHSSQLNQAEKMLEEGRVKLEVGSEDGVFIHVRAWAERENVEVWITGKHTNLSRVVKNGILIYQEKEREQTKNSTLDLTSLTLQELIQTVSDLTVNQLNFLHYGIEINLQIAEEGLQFAPGLGVGSGLKKYFGNSSTDLIHTVRTHVAGACDARMAGLNRPVMTVSGSGNHGLEAIIPVALVAQSTKTSEERTLQAVALSILVTAYVKRFIGRLSPVCGCSIAAGSGVAAALTWLQGGSYEQIGGAVKNIIGNLTGMICDGAKGGCALKLSSAAAEAMLSAELALQDIIISARDGIISLSVEETIANLGVICANGLSGMDRTLLSVMTAKNVQPLDIEKGFLSL